VETESIAKCKVMRSIEDLGCFIVNLAGSEKKSEPKLDVGNRSDHKVIDRESPVPAPFRQFSFRRGRVVELWSPVTSVLQARQRWAIVSRHQVISVNYCVKVDDLSEF
jgi:hypothetical protein